MIELLQKNHKAETQRLNQKTRALQLEKDDLEKAIQDLDIKLQVKQEPLTCNYNAHELIHSIFTFQEKDKELAIHYIYAQRLTKPPSRLVNTPPKGPLINKSVMTEPDQNVKKLVDDNLLLQVQFRREPLCPRSYQ